MAKLLDHKFYASNDAGDEFRYTAKVAVDSSGVFRVTLPEGDESEVFYDIAKKVIDANQGPYRFLRIDRPPRATRVFQVSGTQLQVIEALIKAHKKAAKK